MRVFFQTERLILRQWMLDDLPAFAAINADPQVMEFFPKPLDRAESDATAARIRAHFDQHGFGLWAVSIIGQAPFIGFIGLNVPTFETPFTPCIEIGWRLAHDYWGQGYASEGARAALGFAFAQLKLPEVVSFTVPANARSRGVMERIGMKHSPGDDFEHPNVPVGHPLRPHVVYRLRREEWSAQ